MGELSVPFVNHFCKTPKPQGSPSAWAGAERGAELLAGACPGLGSPLKGVSVCFCLLFTFCAMCVCAAVVVAPGYWPWDCTTVSPWFNDLGCVDLACFAGAESGLPLSHTLSL